MADTNPTTETITVDLAQLQQVVQDLVTRVSGAQNQTQLLEQQQEMELSRRNHEIQMETRRSKIDMIKVATDTLASNAKAKPVDERDITALDIKTFTDELVQYINEE